MLPQLQSRIHLTCKVQANPHRHLLPLHRSLQSSRVVFGCHRRLNLRHEDPHQSLGPTLPLLLLFDL